MVETMHRVTEGKLIDLESAAASSPVVTRSAAPAILATIVDPAATVEVIGETTACKAIIANAAIEVKRSVKSAIAATPACAGVAVVTAAPASASVPVPG